MRHIIIKIETDDGEIEVEKHNGEPTVIAGLGNGSTELESILVESVLRIYEGLNLGGISNAQKH